MAAHAAMLLMATSAGCTGGSWRKRVTLNEFEQTDADLAAEALADFPKPVQCEAHCGSDSLAVRCSPIVKVESASAHGHQLALLEKGEGVIGSICARARTGSHPIRLVGAGESLELAVSAVEGLARDYLLTMPIALSSTAEPGPAGSGMGWTIRAGQLRSVSPSEVEAWLNSRDRLPPE